jgi:hypothetical protein
MSPQLRQLNVSYVATEDRLLLKISTSDDQEYRAWCTRRYARLLLDRLEALFENEVGEPQQVVPAEARKQVAELKHSSAVSEQAFQKPYEAEPESFPLGENGLVLTRFSYREQDNDVVMMTLSGEEGKGLTLNMDDKLRHNFYEILTRACQRAQWFEQGDPKAKPVVH